MTRRRNNWWKAKYSPFRAGRVPTYCTYMSNRAVDLDPHKYFCSDLDEKKRIEKLHSDTFFVDLNNEYRYL